MTIEEKKRTVQRIAETMKSICIGDVVVTRYDHWNGDLFVHATREKAGDLQTSYHAGRSLALWILETLERGNDAS